MLESKYILFFVGALGAFNGLVLGVYFLFFSKKSNLSTIFLGCLLMALSLRIAKSVYVYFNHPLCKIYLQIGLSACLLIGPALLFFVKAAIDQPSRLPRRWRQQIIGLLVIIAVVGILYPYAVYPQIWNHYIIKVIYSVWVIYVAAAGIRLKDIFGRINSAARPLKSPEKWLLAIYTANVFICASFVMSLLFKSHAIYYSGAVIFSFILYSMIFLHLRKGKVAEQFYLVPGKYTAKKVNNAGSDALVRLLNDAMTNAELYKNANLTLSELARTVNQTGHQLSQLLNDNLGRNFTSYVNEYRVNEACRIITNGHPFTLEAIGYEVGFNSKSTFYTAFKKVKGTTPLAYKELLTKTPSKPSHSLSVS